MTHAPAPSRTPIHEHERDRRTPRTLLLTLLLCILPLLVASCTDGFGPTGPGQDFLGPGSELKAGDGAVPADSDDPKDGGATSALDFEHEPSGFSTLSETSYSDGSEGGWDSSPDMQIVTDDTAPKSPGRVAQAVYPAGWDGGYAPMWSTARIEREGAREVYLAFWVRLSENWIGHRTGVNKIAFAWIHDRPSAAIAYYGTGDGPLTTQIRIQNVPGGAKNFTADVRDVVIDRGEWHRWEVLLRSSTGDRANGEAHWWIDGVKAGEHTNIQWGRSGQSEVWETVSWRPTWGGRGGSLPETIRMSMDHFYVSGR